MSTDIEWEKWGAQDPYYGVLTSEKFRSSALTQHTLQEFFDSGQHHVGYVLDVCRRHLDPGFKPTQVLDFGCGVGRLLISFALEGANVTGVDVSPSMLAEARRNCDQRGAPAVTLLQSNDEFSEISGPFDLVHSFIVLQHIPVQRGRVLFQRLVDRIGPAGIGAIHVTFGWNIHVTTYGQMPATETTGASRAPGARQWFRSRLRRLAVGTTSPTIAAETTRADPEMQMNFYNLSELLFILHREGVYQIHTELTDHGGVLGVFLFFRKPT